MTDSGQQPFEIVQVCSTVNILQHCQQPRMQIFYLFPGLSVKTFDVEPLYNVFVLQ